MNSVGTIVGNGGVAADGNSSRICLKGARTPGSFLFRERKKLKSWKSIVNKLIWRLVLSSLPLNSGSERLTAELVIIT
jgi:hypothetical protein